MYTGLQLYRTPVTQDSRYTGLQVNRTPGVYRTTGVQDSRGIQHSSYTDLHVKNSNLSRIPIVKYFKHLTFYFKEVNVRFLSLIFNKF